MMFPSGVRLPRVAEVNYVYLTVLLMVVWSLFPVSLHASPLSCPAEHQIAIEFDNGAGWDLCWESKRRENIVLSEIYYRSPGKQPFKVISSLRLAQLHVAYDDGNITYNDVTQFGLGGGYVSTLIESDCPDGELIDVNDRPGMCKILSRGVEAFRTSTEARHSEIATLFSISLVGSYSYLVTWKFYDDGSIAPSIGAAGALQRSSGTADSPYGRELEGVAGKSWLSHTHNYYWRIDFDLGEDATDDVVSEVAYKVDAEGRRARNVERLRVESARKIDPRSMLAWYITEGSSGDVSGESVEVTRSPGFIIEPLNYGHKLVRSLTEPFTAYDFFVTRQHDCERFISENANFNPGCGNDILAFINDESLVDQDIVVWHRISFHHVPRNEDRHHMHSHWDGFVMQARNLSQATPGHSGVIENSPPILVAPTHLQHAVGEPIKVNVSSSDVDGDALIYSASGLPAGVRLSSSGVLEGRAMTNGNYRVVLGVEDAQHTSKALVEWQIGGAKKGGSGAVSKSMLWVLLMIIGALSIQRRLTTLEYLVCQWFDKFA